MVRPSAGVAGRVGDVQQDCVPGSFGLPAQGRRCAAHDVTELGAANGGRFAQAVGVCGGVRRLRLVSGGVDDEVTVGANRSRLARLAGARTSRLWRHVVPAAGPAKASGGA